jgi:hypothetical protein
MNKVVTDPLTKQSYSVEHLKPFLVNYRIKFDNGPTDVSLHVHFSSHCYTRSRKEDDLDLAILRKEAKHDGTIDERVFCKNRWEFSKSLPSIIKALHSKKCFLGGSRKMFYRQESPTYPGNYDGWYICARLGVSENHKNLTMSIRSAHWLTNRPFEVRGSSKPFYALLSQFYSSERKKRDWL